MQEVTGSSPVSPTTSPTDPHAARPSARRAWPICLLGGFAVGVLTSFGQTVLPFELAPLANSASAWSLAAFGLATVNRDRRRGALLGVLALLASLAGYDATTLARGFAVSVTMGLFWGALAIVVGPVLGVGAAWVHDADPRRRAFGFVPMAGILLGEGLYGVLAIGSSTFAGYWIAQALVGAGLAAFGLRRADLRTRVLVVGATLVVAAGFFVAYSSIG